MPHQPVSTPPAPPVVSTPPAPAHPVSTPPAAYHPVSTPPAHPVSATPVSAAPHSAPPWGLTAPPWSSVAPPQPLTTSPADDEPDEDTTDGVTDPADGSLVAYDVPERVSEVADPSAPVEQEQRPAAYPQGDPAFPPPLAYPMGPEPERRGRGRTVIAVVVGVVVVVVAGVVGAVVLDRDEAAPPSTPPGASPGVPKATGAPPADLKLRDDDTTVTISWSDPTNGGVPFMVAGGRAGKALGVMATVEPGQTSYTVNGLSESVDYCFTVLAVYSTDAFATSGQVCTDRERRSPAG
ncbi:Fibronectin type III domain [Micromonospora halophytica]|uniref:Fibronectin type III domain n=1 Tax=Micromonospora halophytica TaxID=47864 RepID=A0A1C5JHG5_9ACTN|nr:Fibronectin type III domain [Micromonospora halophytica]